MSAVEFLRARADEAYRAWLSAPPEHTTLLALKWASALAALDAELQARARLALTGWRP